MWAAAILAIAVLGFLFYPGHTYLEGDTLIYVPMLERLQAPVLFYEDPMISRPHLALTAYDEITLGLASFGRWPIELVLQAQHFLFRACWVAGIFLIALRFGLTPLQAWLVAALTSLGAVGPTLATVELEPVPRAFAMGLSVLVLGVAANSRFVEAGVLLALAFLYHPTSAAPLTAAALVAIGLRRARPVLLAPLVAAVAVLLVLMHNQTGVTESTALLRRTGELEEALQRQVMSAGFLTEWSLRNFLDGLTEAALAALGWWRLRSRTSSPLRELLGGLAFTAAASLPFNWILRERAGWALLAGWEPMRAFVYVVLLAAVFAAVCGVLAIDQRRWIEGSAWLAAALVLPLKEALISRVADPNLIFLTAGLVAAALVGIWLADKTRGATIVVAGLLPIVAIPLSGLKPAAPRVLTPGLEQLAAWAKAKTDENSVFLFADQGPSRGSGAFRARALRAVYVDYEGRALVNYFPEFTKLWWNRWTDTDRGNWAVTAEDFPRLASFHIDYVVLRIDEVPNRQPEYQNAEYRVYRVVP